MTHPVLFVCSMNVCRSPMMEWAFLEALPDSRSADFSIFSRGIDAGRGNVICAESAKLMQDSESGREFAGSHSSAPMAALDLAAPGLVVVATRAERARLARYAPGLRATTFTLREANLLAAEPATSIELAEIARVEGGLGEPLPLFGFPALLHRRRGTLSFPEPHSWGLRRTDPLDVVDTHLGRPSVHRAMLRSVKFETGKLVSNFTALRAQRGAI